ncbi:MAG: hypothetical protein U0930_19370 [Pirellulales bacterium]
MDLEEYKRTFNDESTPGWDAISDGLTEIYGDQEPSHWGTLISYRLGGPDPLDGDSAYSCRRRSRSFFSSSPTAFRICITMKRRSVAISGNYGF